MNTVGWLSESELEALEALGWRESRLRRDHAPRQQGVPTAHVLPVNEELEPVLDDLQDMR